MNDIRFTYTILLAFVQFGSPGSLCHRPGALCPPGVCPSRRGGQSKRGDGGWGGWMGGNGGDPADPNHQRTSPPLPSPPFPPSSPLPPLPPPRTPPHPPAVPLVAHMAKCLPLGQICKIRINSCTSLPRRGVLTAGGGEGGRRAWGGWGDGGEGWRGVGRAWPYFDS
jgi:hypothetical protein